MQALGVHPLRVYVYVRVKGRGEEMGNARKEREKPAKKLGLSAGWSFPGRFTISGGLGN